MGKGGAHSNNGNSNGKKAGWGKGGGDDWDDWGSGGGEKSSAKKGGDDDWDDWGSASASAGKKSSAGKKASGGDDWGFDEPAEKKKFPAAAKPVQRERKDSWGDEAPAKPKATPPKKAAADDWVRPFETHTHACMHANMYVFPLFPSQILLLLIVVQFSNHMIENNYVYPYRGYISTVSPNDDVSC
jgi:hypothetical protein